MPKIFCNNELVCSLPAGTELQTLGNPLRFGCRQGGCGTCLIEVKSGVEHLSPPTKMERATLARLKAGEKCRLACQAAVKGGHATMIELYLGSDKN